jgi:predicted nucleotidyltransferase
LTSPRWPGAAAPPTIDLLASSDDARADEIIRGLIELHEAVFPGRIAGYYLLGSRADGTALPSSDIDLLILFRGDFAGDEAATARRLRRACERISPLPLDLPTRCERQVNGEAQLEIRLGLKFASRLLYGEDVRERLAAPPIDRYVCWALLDRYRHLWLTRGRPTSLTHPLDPPDPAAEFLGYEQWAMRDPAGRERPTTKLLVNNIGFTAGALVIHQARRYVVSKSQCLRLYRAYVGDAWTALLDDAYGICRDRWAYAIPEAADDRNGLRDLCRRALAFDNHFLAVCRADLLAALAAAEAAPPPDDAPRPGRLHYSEA